jgi:hypothetical protein
MSDDINWTDDDLIHAEEHGRKAARSGSSERSNAYTRAQRSFPMWQAWCKGFFSETEAMRKEDLMREPVDPQAETVVIHKEEF